MRSTALAVLVALTALPVVAATLEDRLAPFLACHGEKGQSTIPEIPSLGAQPECYLSVQLYMFREKMRNVEPMNAMMKEAPRETRPICDAPTTLRWRMITHRLRRDFE